MAELVPRHASEAHRASRRLQHLGQQLGLTQRLPPAITEDEVVVPCFAKALAVRAAREPHAAPKESFAAPVVISGAEN